ncbi:MAG: EpsG family protein [Eubacterium sp.]|nr:EpsG family protein [Eubacterium sp.]MCM1419071.1 EpsG family protein [Roseburia sp.]
MYILMLAASVILGVILCGKRYGTVGRAVYCAVGAIAFIVISATRFEVGYDFNLYSGKYLDLQWLDITEFMSYDWEKGFSLPLFALSQLFEEYYTVIVYTSVITYAAVFWLIYKNSSVPWISVTAFLCFGVYFNSLCFMRQIIAGLIIAYAMKYAADKKPIYFFMLTLAAGSFHWSALIMLGIYFLMKIRPGWIYLGIMTVGSVAAYIFTPQIMQWAYESAPFYSGKYRVEGEGLPPHCTIIFGILFLAAFLLRKRLMERNPANAMYINLLMFSVTFELLGMRHNILARFSLLTYLPPFLYLMPDLVLSARDLINDFFEDTGKRDLAKIGAAAVGSVYALGCFLYLMSINYNGTIPYVSQFDRPYEIFAVPSAEEAEISELEESEEVPTEAETGTGDASEETESDEAALEREILDQIELWD